MAECITRRFFNVIHLFSHSIPIIAIQVNLIDSNSQKLLHFSKILDTYEEPDDDTGPEEVLDEVYWKKKATWALDAANELLELVGEICESPSLKYVKSYITVRASGNRCFTLRKRSSNKSLLSVRVSDDHAGEVEKLLDEQSISYVQKGDRFRFTVDKDFITNHAELLTQIAEFAKETWKK